METDPYRPSEIAEPSADPSRRATLPTALKVVAGFWILLGCLSLLRTIVSLVTRDFSLDPFFLGIFVLGIFLGSGLLARWPGARTCALVCDFIARLFFLFMGTHTIGGILKKSAATPEELKRIAFVVALYFLFRWMDKVLRREEIKALFLRPARGIASGGS